ncbi:class I SAM-dependent DNA methyltransferase [Faecalicoccus pleomorphus]|uniref:class I SAM-dependent DNA methyltransferase n=1 Tax=Faecalicoccus pleomorphus TaxID=1323 RepID=UPI0025A322F3|nr:DNA methyltransferase [Faecalicoccus pleomorphus]MDM8293464.1 hypothetical protein [Faecalicoccus pleomorphus]
MNYNEQIKQAEIFSKAWEHRGNEKSDTQSFWLAFLRNVFGVSNPEEYIQFEKRVKVDGNTKFIDAYIPHTLVLIEQKDYGKDLLKEILQSDRTNLTPYQQAKRYSDNLKRSEKPNWIIICNFKEFYIYDMERPNNEPTHIELKNLVKNIYLFNFLISETNQQLKLETVLSIRAGELVGDIYNKFHKAYQASNLDEEVILSNLNKLCVRLVFCLYAEDSGIFGIKNLFHDYLNRFEPRDMRRALMDLFRVLNTPNNQRDPFIDEDLTKFPYTNGGLFEEDIIIPQITDEIKEMLLEHASNDFDWSDISPTIFGATFESTLNPVTRRSGGMHYTSIENIHKVIDPLFLNDLKDELKEIKTLKQQNAIEKRVLAYQNKLSTLKFLDPACGSGNFLTETYLSLRKLENEAIDFMRKGQPDILMLDEENSPIKVSISQFYGIEINDFAVSVGKTALWIAESQMMKETSDILGVELDFLPLTTNANIIEGNALRIDWNDVVTSDQLNYIMGNPPFVGYSLQTKEQKKDILSIYTDQKGKPYKTAGKVDYVAGWYFKAAQFMQNSNVKTAFVSTNSITQGEQVAAVWKPLYERFNIHIDFAYKTFIWDSEATLKAHVHCVIIGISIVANMRKHYLYTLSESIEVKSINPYLLDAPIIFVESRNKPISDVPEMIKGSSPVDGGNLLLSEEEKNYIIEIEPLAQKYIKRFLGAKEYLHNKPRWCLWLEGISPVELAKLPIIRQRILNTKKFRLASSKAATRKYAEYPTRFMEMRQPNSEYILVPRHSSENRKYIPFGFISSDVICGDANSMIPNATFYHFGILISNVHMLWVQTVCGRIKSDYRYSNDIVYNNFPWPFLTNEQQTKIERTTQSILDARSLYPNSSLADLYDPLLMPIELRKAHEANDKAVMQAYGFKTSMTEGEILAELFKMYEKLVDFK